MALSEGIDLLQVLLQYDKRFAQAMVGLPDRSPWLQKDREEIRDTLRKCLGIREEWIPELTVETVQEMTGAKFSIRHLRFTSWKNCRGAAHLYLPRVGSQQPCPIVFIACGHAVGGKQAKFYRLQAELLARCGIAALVSDNIGQGERKAMGHRQVPGVFACGLSLQGLIVMESMAWLRWIQRQECFDDRKIAVVGNSGGGTLSMLLGALCTDSLAALSSSGYPSSFEFVGRKEKVHCHCNILPGVVGELEMWHVFGCFAPKPLFLFP